MPRKILIIEDNRDLAHLLEIHLGDLSYEVDLAFDGREGLAKAESRDYDLVILDLMLPGLDGLEICRRLRNGPVYTPILMLTSKSSETEDYATLITISTKMDGQERAVSGTLFGKRELRLVRIDDYRIECDPSGNLLILSNEDMPGIIGNVGTLLGKHKVNIAGMTLGRNVKGGKAVTGLNVDQEVTETVLTEIRKLPHVLEARFVKL